MTVKRKDQMFPPGARRVAWPHDAGIPVWARGAGRMRRTDRRSAEVGGAGEVLELTCRDLISHRTRHLTGVRGDRWREDGRPRSSRTRPGRAPERPARVGCAGGGSCAGPDPVRQGGNRTGSEVSGPAQEGGAAPGPDLLPGYFGIWPTVTLTDWAVPLASTKPTLTDVPGLRESRTDSSWLSEVVVLPAIDVIVSPPRSPAL